MHRTVAIGVTALALSVPAVATVAAPAQAVTHFANCTAMHRVYKHGVARSATAAAVQVRKGYGRPVVNASLYRANVGSDRDKDGTACEA